MPIRAPSVGSRLVRGAVVAPSETEESTMHPYLSQALVEARQDELLRQAEHHRLVSAARAGRRSWLRRRLRAVWGRGFRRPAVADGRASALSPKTDKLRPPCWRKRFQKVGT